MGDGGLRSLGRGHRGEIPRERGEIVVEAEIEVVDLVDPGCGRCRRHAADLHDTRPGDSDDCPGRRALLDDGARGRAGRHGSREVCGRGRQVEIAAHQRHRQAGLRRRGGRFCGGRGGGGRSRLRWRRFRATRHDARRRRGRSRTSSHARVLHHERVPTLGASHLQSGRRDSPLVDLVGRLAGLALDFQHSPSSPSIRPRVPHGIAQTPSGLRRFAERAPLNKCGESPASWSTRSHAGAGGIHPGRSGPHLRPAEKAFNVFPSSTCEPVLCLGCAVSCARCRRHHAHSPFRQR